MSRPTSEAMGQSLSYQAYLTRYVLYFIRCPTKGRPKDCVHPCPRYIHSGQCEPCTQFVELECYCEATGIVKPCKEWCDMEDDQKQLVKCCRVRCAKIMECGHQCPRICHAGRCADPKECVENVVRYCGCERIERVFPCRGCGAKDQEVQCDHICAQLLKTYRQAIAEMKNNPVKLTEGHKDADGSAAGGDNCNSNNNNNNEVEVSSAEDVSTIAIASAIKAMTNDSETLSSPEAKQESESESGFNEDKTEGDDRIDADTDAEHQPEIDRGTAEPHRQDQLEDEAEPTDPEIVAAEQKATLDSHDGDDHCERETCESPHSEESSRRSLQRVSRSSSRVSSYSEEDIPRQLDQDKIVKIMRSSTRRKKLIKCGQDIINEMKSS